VALAAEGGEGGRSGSDGWGSGVRNDSGYRELKKGSRRTCPPAVLQNASERVNSPAQRRGDCIQTKPTNQTQTYPSQAQQHTQPNKRVLPW